jgi:hypothetical protein
MGMEMLVAGSAISSFMGAQQTNRAARRGYGMSAEQYRLNLEALERTRKVTTEQVSDQSEVEQWKNYMQGMTLTGRVRAAVASSGSTTSMGGTGQRIETQTFMDRLRNARFLDESLINTIEKINSDYLAGGVGATNQYTQLTQNYYSQMQSPFLNAFGAGVQTYGMLS